jgi:D-amino-acid dehydrogenase
MAPTRVVVVGAGMVGLSCAWSLLGHGAEVEVLDKGAAGAGSSWGNAGYIAPAFTVPLPEPSVLRYGVRAVLDPRSPVRVPWRPDAERTRFLWQLARNCTEARWTRAMRGYRRLNEQIFAAFDAQRDAGVRTPVRDAAVLAAFVRAADADGILHELDAVAAAGQPVEADILTGAQAREAEPNLTERIALAVRVKGQRYLDPVAYTAALADQVRARGGKVTEHTRVTGVAGRGGRTAVRTADGTRDADAVVLAAGAWLPGLAAAHGVRVPQFGGRGYSFTVPLRRPLRGPVYFPAVRSALAPRDGRARVTGVMEFQRPDAPPDPAHVPATVRAVRPLLDADWDRVRDRWVGARPLTADGVPLVGPSATGGVYVAGGHGMWGVTLGPLTGRLLADHIMTGAMPPELAWLDPLR